MQFGNYLAGAKPSEGRDNAPIPVGVYAAYITRVKDVDSRNDPNWQGVEFEFTIATGPHAKRKIWQLWTLNCSPSPNIKDLPGFLNEQREQLVGLLTAAKHPSPNNPDGHKIEGLQVGIRTTIRTDKKTGDKKAAVVGWLPVEQVGAAPAAGRAGFAHANAAQAPAAQRFQPMAVGQFSRQAQPQAQPAPAPQAQDNPGDEIPF